MAQHLLIVEGDAFSRSLITGFLEAQGFLVTSTDLGVRALSMLESDDVTLILLDLGSPEMDGIDILRRIRGRSTVPVIVTSSSGSVDCRVDVFEAGADDFLIKPFHPKELTSRIKAVLRRGQPSASGFHETTSAEYEFKGWRLRKFSRDLLSPDGESVTLTPAEFNLLSALLRLPLHVLTRDELLDAITRGEEAPVDRSIDVLVSRLRRKIEVDPRRPRYIQTVQSFGYRFSVPVVEQKSGGEAVRAQENCDG